MFNKLKYPARGDLPVRGIEFVEGTGASYGLQVVDPAAEEVHFGSDLTTHNLNLIELTIESETLTNSP